MGCSQSSQYYLGFINVSFSHVDVLSFVLGVEITIGTVYLVGCIRDHKKANNQILGRGKAKNYHGWEARNGPDWVSYPMHVVPRTSPSMTPPSDQSPLPTAPYPIQPKSPVAIPWPSNALQWKSLRSLSVTVTTSLSSPTSLFTSSPFQLSLWTFFSVYIAFWHGKLNFWKMENYLTWVGASKNSIVQDVMTLCCLMLFWCQEDSIWCHAETTSTSSG